MITPVRVEQELDEVRVGFIPLSDVAPLAVAAGLGFAEQEGLRITLLRETSWATLRDRLAVGALDAAHMLAPMPIAANLGLGPLPMSLVVPMALGFGGNTVTVSRAVWADLVRLGAGGDLDAAATATAMARLVAERRAQREPRPVLGIVHHYSAHHYELAYWLASAGVEPGRDVELVVVPPSLMAAALEARQLDGFCAGEPWGSVAVAEGAGHILTTKAHIWRSSPEKVLAVRRDWAEEDAGRLARLVRAVYRAAVWCDEAANRDRLVDLLAGGELLAQPAAVLRPGIARELDLGDGLRAKVSGFLTFAERAATFPWVSHALWLYTQMVRWRQVGFSAAAADVARATYRPDLYRAALAPLAVAVPSASAKVEGALTRETPVGTATGRLTLGPDGFFDGRMFDPDRVADYLGEP
jgi:NitT/TauT family transport system ATP-binding protein